MVFQKFFKKNWGTYSMLKCCDTWIMLFHKFRRMGRSSKPHSLEDTIKILKCATIKAECSCFMILFLFCWSKINFILKIANFKFQIRANWFGRSQLMFCKLCNLRKFTKISWQMFAKMFWILFYLSFFLIFLLIISDKVVRSCLCRQDLRICVL